MAERCGFKHCTERRLDEARFCDHHQPLMARIRDEFQAEEKRRNKWAKRDPGADGHRS